MNTITTEFILKVNKLYKDWIKYDSRLTFEQFCELRGVEDESK
jgi:hypothetical protein